jgi:ABC-type nitrate/sulfonate/bicarbonate transport system substrate-binding protein
MKGTSFAILTVLLMVTGCERRKWEVLKPKGNRRDQAWPSIDDFALRHAGGFDPRTVEQERMECKSVEFTRTDQRSGVAQGTIQIANSQVMDPVRAIQKGAKLSFVMENNGGEFLMIAKNEIKDCKDTDGKRFAIHGEAATTSLAAKLWLLNDCKVKPNIMVIPGGENRIIALQNNQIDATLVQLGDWLNLDSQAPGRYHIIRTGGLFNISGASYWANVEWLRKNEEVATAYIAELLRAFGMVMRTKILSR